MTECAKFKKAKGGRGRPGLRTLCKCGKTWAEHQGQPAPPENEEGETRGMPARSNVGERLAHKMANWGKDEVKLSETCCKAMPDCECWW